MRQSAYAFKCGGLTLEGVAVSPDGAKGSFPATVVCHPHPLFGGDMENSLVVVICRVLAEAGFVAFRFNFRGVGKSSGTFTRGEEEREDIRAALNFLAELPRVNRSRRSLVEYSFGASIVLEGLSRYKAAKAIALVAPPISEFEHSEISRDKKPKLFLGGDQDKLVPPSKLKEKFGALGQRAKLQVVSGADHSWRGFEEKAALLITDFFKAKLRE